jgi:hypothetical protein
MKETIVKTTYRIRKHVADFISGPGSKLPYTFFSVEVLLFKFWFFEYWKTITNFKPICKDYVFDTIDDAKDAITKYNAYHYQLNQNGMIVDKFELD